MNRATFDLAQLSVTPGLPTPTGTPQGHRAAGTGPAAAAVRARSGSIS